MLLFTKEGIPSVSTHLINNNQSWLTYGASEWKSGIPHTHYAVVNLNIPFYTNIVRIHTTIVYQCPYTKRGLCTYTCL